jgi:hypothetical protein
MLEEHISLKSIAMNTCCNAQPISQAHPLAPLPASAVLQFEAVAMWVWASRPGGLCLDLSAIQLWQWLAFLLLFSFGQALNTGVYRAIGTTGE